MGSARGPFPWVGMLMWLGLYVGPWLIIGGVIWFLVSR